MLFSWKHQGIYRLLRNKTKKKHDGVKEESRWHNPVLLCVELAGFDTGVNTKALEYRDNKSDTGTHAHTDTHTRTGGRAALQKERLALVAREHMSLQPTWDSEQRKETATPVTAHAWGQTHTDHCIRVCVWVCACHSVHCSAQGPRFQRGWAAFLEALTAKRVRTSLQAREMGPEDSSGEFHFDK